MAILFSMAGLAPTSAFVAGAAQRMANPGPALRFIGEQQLTRNTRRLAAGVDVDGRTFKRSRRGGKTLWQTGALAASMNYQVGAKHLDYFSTDKRARVHYEGLEIRPKAGKKFLTIPLRAEGGMFAGAGVSANANRLGDRAGHYARKSTFFAWRNSKLFLFQKTGKGTIRALFLLVRKVQMVRRKWMGFSAEDVELANQVLAKHATGSKS